MHCKSFSHFFSKKFQHVCVPLDVNFNESLTNDIVSFEQLGPGAIRSCVRCVKNCKSCTFAFFSSNYISQLPLVFVFGIATSVSAVHRLLPNEVSSLLCMEKFQAPPSTEYLTLLINQVNLSTYTNSKDSVSQ